MSKTGSHYFINRSGLRLHYLTWGEKDKPAVLLLHGLRSYALTWNTLAPILAEKFYVIALDQRGRGMSDWAPKFETYQTSYYVQDIEDLVGHENLDSLIIVGHSLGGANALEFARQHPGSIKALVIEDIGPGSSTHGEGAERIRREMQSTPLTFNSWEDAEKFWKKLRPLIDEKGIHSRLENTLVEKEGVIQWKHDQQGISKARLSIPSVDLWPAVEQISCPTLFIKGGLSDFLSLEIIEQIRLKKPEIQFVGVTGASHYVHDDQPEIFNEIVSKFLNSLI
ncbi:alpha/beta fold hydrolase [Acinetobacter baumannii]|uniref:alpha/beta fold hydrolase n=1 Tax=Acinetobacter baumannii TaxID=470 RepID=UPI0010C80E60|nr:alpha/beta hydrolase [Acinetobacter baumannii]QCP38438.1 alpha/beta hydrolase [Acinetobacter baumannii]